MIPWLRRRHFTGFVGDGSTASWKLMKDGSYNAFNEDCDRARAPQEGVLAFLRALLMKLPVCLVLFLLNFNHACSQFLKMWGHDVAASAFADLLIELHGAGKFMKLVLVLSTCWSLRHARVIADRLRQAKVPGLIIYSGRCFESPLIVEYYQNFPRTLLKASQGSASELDGRRICVFGKMLLASMTWPGVAKVGESVSMMINLASAGVRGAYPGALYVEDVGGRWQIVPGEDGYLKCEWTWSEILPGRTPIAELEAWSKAYLTRENEFFSPAPVFEDDIARDWTAAEARERELEATCSGSAAAAGSGAVARWDENAQLALIQAIYEFATGHRIEDPRREVASGEFDLIMSLGPEQAAAWRAVMSAFQKRLFPRLAMPDYTFLVARLASPKLETQPASEVLEFVEKWKPS